MPECPGVFCLNVFTRGTKMANPAELNPIIAQLSRIDKMASEEAAKAAGRKEALLDEFSAEKALYDAQLKAETDERLAVLKAALAQETGEKITRAKQEYEGRAAALDEEYERNGEQWAQEIFNAVIGG